MRPESWLHGIFLQHLFFLFCSVLHGQRIRWRGYGSGNRATSRYARSWTTVVCGLYSGTATSNQRRAELQSVAISDRYLQR